MVRSPTSASSNHDGHVVASSRPGQVFAVGTVVALDASARYAHARTVWSVWTPVVRPRGHSLCGDQAHKARLWIWNAHVEWQRIRGKKTSVLEVQGLLKADFGAVVSGWAKKSRRFSRLQHASFLQPHVLERILWPTTLKTLELYPYGHHAPRLASLPPNLERLSYVPLDKKGVVIACWKGLDLARHDLPAGLKILQGISCAMLQDEKTPWPPQLTVVALDCSAENRNLLVSRLPKTATDVSVYYYDADYGCLPASVERLSVSLSHELHEDLNPPAWPDALREISIGRLNHVHGLAGYTNWPKNLTVLRLGVATYRCDDVWQTNWDEVARLVWPASLQRFECHRFNGDDWKMVQSPEFVLPAQWPKDVRVRVWSTVQRVVVFERVTG